MTPPNILRQLDRVYLDGIGNLHTVLRIYQPEAVVSYRVVAKQLFVEQANRDRRPQVRTTPTGLQLIDVHRRSVVDQPLQQPGKDRHLHLDVQPPTSRIASPDIQYDELVVREFLVAERIEDLNVDDRMGELQDGVQQPDQNGMFSGLPKTFLNTKSTVGLIPSNIGFPHEQSCRRRDWTLHWSLRYGPVRWRRTIATSTACQAVTFPASPPRFRRTPDSRKPSPPANPVSKNEPGRLLQSCWTNRA